MTFRVNSVSVEWEEQDRRSSPKPCDGCAVPTRGRATINQGVQVSMCRECAIRAGMERAMAPIQARGRAAVSAVSAVKGDQQV